MRPGEVFFTLSLLGTALYHGEWRLILLYFAIGTVINMLFWTKQ